VLLIALACTGAGLGSTETSCCVPNSNTGIHQYIRPARAGYTSRLVKQQHPIVSGEVVQFVPSPCAATLSSGMALHIIVVRCSPPSSLGAWQAAAIASEQLAAKDMDASPLNLHFKPKMMVPKQRHKAVIIPPAPAPRKTQMKRHLFSLLNHPSQ
jgi:hypothetical protein